MVSKQLERDNYTYTQYPFLRKVFSEGTCNTDDLISSDYGSNCLCCILLIYVVCACIHTYLNRHSLTVQGQGYINCTTGLKVKYPSRQNVSIYIIMYTMISCLVYKR